MKRNPALLVAGLLAAAALAAWWLSGTRGGEARQADSVDSPAAAEREPARGLAAAELAGVRAEAAAAPAGEHGAAQGAPLTPAARLARAAPDVRRVHVFGRVVDREGHPIQGAVLLSPPDDAAAVLASTGADGRLDAELELAVDRKPLQDWFYRDGFLSASVAAAGFTALNAELDVRQGARFHLGTLVLLPGTPASGRVVDREGRGIAGARVEWYRAAQLAALKEDFETGDLPFLPARDGPDDTDLALGANAGPDGVFHLLGVPREAGVLAGLADGHRHGVTDVLPFDAGEPVDVRLELPDGPTEQSQRFAGTVLRPDGTPQPGARVTVHGPEGGIQAFGESGAEGRFEVLLRPWPREPVRDRVAMTVRASDPGQDFSPGEVAGVMPDGPDIAIRLTPARLLEVRLVDRAGAHIPWGHVRSEDAAESFPLTPLGAEGRGVFLLPDQAFTVEALAPGFRTETFGPFDPTRLGAALELALTPGEAVRGRVVAGGKPVAGARVALTQSPFPAGTVGRARNVAPMDWPFDLAGSVAMEPHDATTASDGTFVATLPGDGWFTLAAEADGYARSVLGPFEWKRADGASGLVLELERPGAIEGRVLVPPGQLVEGLLVAASNGFGEAWIAPADAQGRFELAGLAPGGWQLRPGVPPLGEREHLLQSGVRSSARPMLFDVDVRAGETSQAILDLAQRAEHVLQGRLTLDGAGMPGARVYLQPGDRAGRPDDHNLAGGEVSADGGFELRLRAGGQVVLAAYSEVGIMVLQPLELSPGITTWELDLRSATVLVTGTPPKAPGDRPTMYVFRTRTAGGALVLRRGLGDPQAEGPTRVAPVPSGDVDLLFAPFPDGIVNGYLDDTVWSRVTSVHLEPGRETALELP